MAISGLEAAEEDDVEGECPDFFLLNNFPRKEFLRSKFFGGEVVLEVSGLLLAVFSASSSSS